MKVPCAGHKVVILDRDGTLVVDRGYLADPEGLEFITGAAEALRTLFESGFRLVVISNQSGIGRGYFPCERMEAMNARLRDMVREAGAELEAIYFCPHAPEEQCACRKPALGLLEQAAGELNFEPACAIVIGDKPSDVEFGRRAGATTILIAAAAAAAAPPPSTLPQADFVVHDLTAAAGAILTLAARSRTSSSPPP